MLDYSASDLLSGVASAVVTAVAGVVGWLFMRVDNIKSLAERNETRIDAMKEQVDSLNKIPERLASLEATVAGTMSDLRESLDRLADSVKDNSKH